VIPRTTHQAAAYEKSYNGILLLKVLKEELSLIRGSVLYKNRRNQCVGNVKKEFV
jgi:hypothetical protein